MLVTALYTGSFDPLTLGHLDVITSAGAFCSRLVVAIGVHPGKTPLLAVEEREALIRAVCGRTAAAGGASLDVVTFAGLAVEAARLAGATLLIRGLRDATDFDYEMQMAGMNAAMAPEIRTLFIPASPGVRHITATLVRQIAALGGDVSPFVPAEVASRFKGKFARAPATRA
ncbi:MAG: pantetheine-phosphate adenylyltransferase [Roseiarcus sp.]|jgi:pantetheine-phosphate adenylyltransferase